MSDPVCGPVALAALTRAVAEAHRQRDALVLVANLRDLAAAALNWAAQVERTLRSHEFTIPEGAPRAPHRRTDRVPTAGSGRTAAPRSADLAAGEGVRAEVIA